jgi:hypothetical protein
VAVERGASHAPPVRRWASPIAVLSSFALAALGAEAQLWEDEHHPPPIRLRVVPSAEGEILVIENRSRLDVELDTAIAIEELSGDSARVWIEPRGGAGALRMVAACDEEPAAQCRVLPAGASMRVVPWSGYYGAPQCPFRTPSDFAAPTGRYRYVVRACGDERSWQFRSPAFRHVARE